MLRGTAFGGNYRKIRMLYSLEDPWEMASECEQYRFAKTMEQLRAVMPHFSSILELGCGEGHQSVYLSELSDELFGIDISKTAVSRAVGRCPQATFATMALEDAGSSAFGERHFNLITACEVLYYTIDITKILTELQARTDRLYVSNYHPRSKMMQAHFSGDGWKKLNSIQFEGTIWDCFLWEAPSVRNI